MDWPPSPAHMLNQKSAARGIPYNSNFLKAALARLRLDVILYAHLVDQPEIRFQPVHMLFFRRQNFSKQFPGTKSETFSQCAIATRSSPMA